LHLFDLYEDHCGLRGTASSSASLSPVVSFGSTNPHSFDRVLYTSHCDWETELAVPFTPVLDLFSDCCGHQSLREG
jgi:hypothetical protein